MQEDRAQLLERILASRQFAHAESLKRILRYLCTNSEEGATQSLREYDIAVNAIGRLKTFDPKIDPIIRVSIAGIRERLRSYYENEGRHEKLRLEIPKGQYRAHYHEVATASAQSEIATAVVKFWQPYLTTGANNVCVYSEVLFFRDEHGSFVRNIFVNDLSHGRDEMAQRIPEVAFDQFRPSYHFLSAGEVHCLLFISRQLQDLGARLEMRNSRFCAWNELRSSNLILIGSSRTSRFVDALQGDLPFSITEDRIVNRQPSPGEQGDYQGRRYLDGKLERVSEFAVITRQPGLAPDTTITVIAANHGRAIEAAGFFLTREEALTGLLRKLGEDRLPERFQILLSVDLIDFDEDVVNVDYVTHRVF